MKKPYIQGRKLLESPYDFTEDNIFNAVTEGILVPYWSPDADWIREHDFLESYGERVLRFFPTDALRKKYNQLLTLQLKLELAQKWVQRSDEEHIEEYKSWINLDWGGPRPSNFVDLETYVENLPNMRQVYLQNIQEYPPEIDKLEEELAPDKVWKNLGLGPTQEAMLLEKLLDAWYPSDQVESISISKPQEIIGLCKPGTQWKDITITLVSDEMVRIQAPNLDRRFTYHDLGMADKRKGDSPTMLWAILKIFAKNNGIISREKIEYDPRLPDIVKRLNSHLKKFFGINESIFQAHYKKERSYKTKIKFKDNRECQSENNIEDETLESPYDEVMKDFQNF